MSRARFTLLIVVAGCLRPPWYLDRRHPSSDRGSQSSLVPSWSGRSLPPLSLVTMSTDEVVADAPAADSAAVAEDKPKKVERVPRPNEKAKKEKVAALLAKKTACMNELVCFAAAPPCRRPVLVLMCVLRCAACTDLHPGSNAAGARVL